MSSDFDSRIDPIQPAHPGPKANGDSSQPSTELSDSTSQKNDQRSPEQLGLHASSSPAKTEPADFSQILGLHQITELEFDPKEKPEDDRVAVNLRAGNVMSYLRDKANYLCDSFDQLKSGSQSVARVPAPSLNGFSPAIGIQDGLLFYTGAASHCMSSLAVIENQPGTDKSFPQTGESYILNFDSPANIGKRGHLVSITKHNINDPKFLITDCRYQLASNEIVLERAQKPNSLDTEWDAMMQSTNGQRSPEADELYQKWSAENTQNIFDALPFKALG